MRLIFSCQIRPIFQHDLLRNNIVFVHPQIDLLFGDNVFCDLKSGFS